MPFELLRGVPGLGDSYAFYRVIKNKCNVILMTEPVFDAFHAEKCERQPERRVGAGQTRNETCIRMDTGVDITKDQLKLIFEAVLPNLPSERGRQIANFLNVNNDQVLLLIPKNRFPIVAETVKMDVVVQAPISRTPIAGNVLLSVFVSESEVTKPVKRFVKGTIGTIVEPDETKREQIIFDIYFMKHAHPLAQIIKKVPVSDRSKEALQR